MDLDECKRRVKAKFPFPAYLDGSLGSVVDSMAEVVTRYLDRGGRILDFGSGPCDKTAVVQCLGFQCSAFDDLGDHWHRRDDSLQQILEFTRRVQVDFRLADDGYLPFPPESFDMVMSHDVLEHLHDSPRELLNDLCELLKAGGLLFLTVPNAVNIRKRIAVLRGRTNLPEFATYYWYPGSWRGHVREYVERDLRLLAQYLGLEILELRGCHHMLHRVPRPVLPLYRLATSLFPGWRDSWLLVARKPDDWKPNRELSEREFYEIMGPVSPFYNREKTFS